MHYLSHLDIFKLSTSTFPPKLASWPPATWLCSIIANSIPVFLVIVRFWLGNSFRAGPDSILLGTLSGLLPQHWLVALNARRQDLSQAYQNLARQSALVGSTRKVQMAKNSLVWLVVDHLHGEPAVSLFAFSNYPFILALITCILKSFMHCFCVLFQMTFSFCLEVTFITNVLNLCATFFCSVRLPFDKRLMSTYITLSYLMPKCFD